MIGSPRLHLRLTDSTNLRARELALRGAPHGTVVTAAEQTAGRGRQGRTWTAPAGRALLLSVVVRDPPPLLPLVAAVAVAQTVGDAARIKWPNDVLLGGRKVAGILVEGRPQEHWTVAGIGLNVAIRPEDLPDELRDRATGMGLEPRDVERVLGELLAALDHRLGEPASSVLAAWRTRDALLGQEISWNRGEGRAEGVDDHGRLLVRSAAGETLALDAGEVHLRRRR
jgi:BirA family transcriptional regulator, biotin operon repressor / biotin---[acetyl-CoA-carboxylase] ligase